MRRLILGSLLLACTPAKAPPTAATAEELDAAPQLPSPYAGSYARVVATPKDPVVRLAIGDRTWEASLAGAAAGLALDAAEDRGGMTRRHIREAAWQAGYPWPIQAIAFWPTSEGGSAPADLGDWLQNQPRSRDIGVVRARGRGKDVWVALAASPLMDLGVIPKEMVRGQKIRLPARPGARYRVADGAGALTEGALDQEVDLTLSSPGEWIVQVLDDGGDLARFPLYVEQKPPRAPVFPAQGAMASTPRLAVERSLNLYNIARQHYGAPTAILDPLLQAAATQGLDPAVRLEETARKMAGSDEVVFAARTTGTDVDDVLDRWLYDPRYRAAFVADQVFSAGFAATVGPNEVTLTAVWIGRRP